jgi:zinc protease
VRSRRKFGRWADGILPVIAGLAAAGMTIWGKEFPPAAVAPPQVAIPAPVLRTLPNGLRVILIKRRSVPLVTLHAMVMAGSENDPPGRAGMAEFVAGLLTEGTRKRSALDIAQAIDRAGGTIDAGAGWDETIASVSVLADRKALAFDLLSDILMHPAFAPAEIERYRRQTLSALRVLKDDPRYVADAVLRRELLAGTPYAHPPEGTEATLNALTRRDLQGFHQRYFGPKNTTLAVLGDVTPQEGFDLAGKYFGGWRGREAAPVKSPPSPEPKPLHGVILINEPGAVETEIRVGNPGVARSSPAYVPLTVANQILGGPAGNQLYLDLRTELGLTYSASSALHCYRTLGTWIAKTSTRTGDTVKAVTQMLRQIRRIRTHPPSEPQIQMARNYLVGHLALQFEPLDGIAGHFLELILYGLPLDYWSDYAERIHGVTPEDVLSIASTYLQPHRQVIVLVGNVAGFAKQLKQFGRVRVIPLSRLDLRSPDLETREPATKASGAAGN